MPVKALINHIAIVLDASDSMRNIRQQTADVADIQIKDLAQRSKELDQETRITVYKFSDNVDPIVYDTDAIRLASKSSMVQSAYRTGGMTALRDATMQSIVDLEKSATIYGDHSFLIFILTDGAENASRKVDTSLLKQKLGGLRDNWTIAVLVPNAQGVHEAKKLGFAAGNIAVWDTTAKGIVEVGERIQAVTQSYMTARATGNFRGTSNLFDMDTRHLTPNVVQKVLTEIHPRVYLVEGKQPIRDYLTQMSGRYEIGSAYYQLVKPEEIQPQKQIIVRDKVNDKFFTGPSARDLLGLPDYKVTVLPKDHVKYDIFVQSTSVNRNLVDNTEVVVYSN